MFLHLSKLHISKRTITLNPLLSDTHFLHRKENGFVVRENISKKNPDCCSGGLSTETEGGKLPQSFIA